VGEVTALRPHGLSGPVRLDHSHNVEGFDCGNRLMNDWLGRNALASEGRWARTYVACEGETVVGYYCISSGSVDRRELPRKLKEEQVQSNKTPVGLIGRLARDVRYRGTSLGGDLLRDALTRIVSASEIIGIRCILVHAVDDQAMAFYKRHTDFAECPIGSRTLYLPIETAAAVLAG
jgi:hypothetical protein